MLPPRGEDYETDESWPQVKPAQEVKKDMVPSRKRAKMSIKRASPAGEMLCSCGGRVPDGEKGDNGVRGASPQRRALAKLMHLRLAWC